MNTNDNLPAQMIPKEYFLMIIILICKFKIFFNTMVNLQKVIYFQKDRRKSKISYWTSLYVSFSTKCGTPLTKKVSRYMCQVYPYMITYMCKGLHFSTCFTPKMVKLSAFLYKCDHQARNFL